MFLLCRDRLSWLDCLVQDVSTIAPSPTATSYFQSFTPHKSIQPRTYGMPRHLLRVLVQRSNIIGRHGLLGNWLPAKYIINASVELKTGNGVVWFSLDKPDGVILLRMARQKRLKRLKLMNSDSIVWRQRKRWIL